MKVNPTVVVLTILMIVFASAAFYYCYKDSKAQSKLEVIKTLNTLGTDTSISDSAGEYYTQASRAYEKQDWKDVVTSCESARDKFSDYGQYLRDEKAKIASRTEEVFKTYSELLQTEVELNMNLYEACEHFESAARYFETYYLPETPSTDSSFEMGNQEIRSMNEKINEHDANVERYNTLLAEYRFKLKEYLE